MLSIVLKNTTSNVLLFVAKLLITFIMTPVFLRNLGNYDYGIWEIIVVITGYMGMLDIGIKPAASRFAAYYKGRNDQESLLQVYSTTLVLMFGIGIASFIFMLIWALFYPELLSEADSDKGKYAFLLIIIGTQLLFSFPGQITESFLEGFQKYHLKNIISLGISIAGSVAIYYTITQANGIILLALISSAGLLLKYLVFAWLLSRSEHGAIHFSFSAYKYGILAELFNFGLKTFIQGIGTKISVGSGSIIIASIIGPAYVVFYAIPSNLSQHISSVRMLLTHTFMPLFSDFFAREEHELARIWFQIGSKFVVAAVTLLSMGIIMLGKDFIHIWLGQEYADKGAAILYIFCIYHLISTINPFANRYLTAINKHGFLAKTSMVQAPLNIVLSLVLVYFMGIEGVAIGSLLPVMIITPVILRYTCRHIEINMLTYLKASIFPIILPSLGLVATVLLLKNYFLIDNYPILLSASFIAALVYLLIFVTLSTTTEERAYILRRKNHQGS